MAVVSQLETLYALSDKAVAEFQLRSGLRCPPGCGKCCLNSDVQVSVTEMLPMAQAMLCDQTAARWLDRLLAAPEAGTCVLYRENPEQGATGCCRYYPWRPLVCRLFGFAAILERSGSRVLSVCRHLRETDPCGTALARSLAAEAPCFVHFSARVYGLDPASGHRLLPINTALRQAIQRLGLNFSYCRAEKAPRNTAA